MEKDKKLYLIVRIDLKEEWKVFKQNDNYSVSNFGNVKRIDKNKLMTLCYDGRGYLRVCLCKDGIVSHYTVHRMVALTFLGKRPKGYQVNHIDGIKRNNNILNLEYVIPKENYRHAAELGLINPPKGRKHHNAKLIEYDVKEIKEMLSINMTHFEIAKEFNVTREAITSISRGRTWKHVG